jgi:hypothetical protein
MMKEAMASPPFTQGMPAQIKLRAFQPANYTIDLTLIEMEFAD